MPSSGQLKEPIAVYFPVDRAFKNTPDYRSFKYNQVIGSPLQRKKKEKKSILTMSDNLWMHIDILHHMALHLL